MKVNGIEGISEDEITRLVAEGGKFVVYEYAISVLVMSFKRSSDVYFVRPGENALVKGLGFTLLTLILGWWGFPWGPIYTVGALMNNFKGGKDVTSHFNS